MTMCQYLPVDSKPHPDTHILLQFFLGKWWKFRMCKNVFSNGQYFTNRRSELWLTDLCFCIYYWVDTKPHRRMQALARKSLLLKFPVGKGEEILIVSQWQVTFEFFVHKYLDMGLYIYFSLHCLLLKCHKNNICTIFKLKFIYWQISLFSFSVLMSSVALSYDTPNIPSRSSCYDACYGLCGVNFFKWGSPSVHQVKSTQFFLSQDVKFKETLIKSLSQHKCGCQGALCITEEPLF